MRRLLAICAAAMVLIVPAFGRAAGNLVVAVQLLDYERGFVFFTSGDGFRVAPHVAIVDAATGMSTALVPAPRLYADVTFASDGTVTRIALSRKKLAAQGDLADVHRFAVALSPSQPNPELGAQVPQGECVGVVPGHRTAVLFEVEVPPTTALTDTVYMTSDQLGWNPQALRMQRVDALHYRTAMRVLSGTVLHYLFDRGSTQSLERGESGLQIKPLTYCARTADAQVVRHRVYHWGDETGTSALPVPQTLPTPYNPAPFPNLPTRTPAP